ncbi:MULTISPECIES: hypothetical protein [Streptomyces]|uniref:Uncharacterized protein n=1 Tax=Streptomyces amritsarensis TaxID=681158 RepID=A0ABX3FWD0_9ACTN|nr:MULTISPECIES: hypothetical protein [Streptomyces]AQT71608.1 hypothetical protein B1K54_07840 [Streptomyces sp. fd1-xmd]MDX6762240.1 hypothetical protein [Streptomyces sp. F8]OLZ58606.1 hypothetical protein AVW11_27645 [Streptomyces amritsarensis]
MDGTGTDQTLASRWDVPLALLAMVRVAFGDLPLWAKAGILGLVGSVGVWTAITWLRGRRSRVG